MIERWTALCTLALLSACSETTTNTNTDAQSPTDVVAAPDTPAPPDRPAPVDAPAPMDRVIADTPSTDTPSTDTPSTDTPRADVVSTDIPSSDTPTVDAPSVTAAGRVSPCPADTPEANAPCAREGLACQYGSDPRESCRVLATCETGRWLVLAPRCVPLVDPAMCPASRDVAAGADCATMNATCDYGGLGCTCTNCRSFPVGVCSGPLRWRCTAPNMAPGCPAVQPNLGTVCAMDGQRCTYDCEATGPGGGRVCQGGVWQASTNNCPISTRAAKRDIRYLSNEESEAIARAALGTRLATYEYTDPALRGRRRLGFIYEDPTTHRYARDPDISGVDLYGYTSMLLATVQQQQREIAALRRAVEQLQRRGH